MSYKIIVLDNPSITLRENKMARSIFGSILGERFDSYYKSYNEEIKPFSELDFISSHLIIADKENNPVYSFRVTSHEMCKRNSLDFPLISFFKNQKLRDEELVVTKSVLNDKAPVYLGGRSKTKSPLTRTENALINEISVALMFFGGNFYGRELYLLGMVENKSHDYCMRLGFEKVFPDECRVDFLNDKLALVLKKKKWSDYATELAVKHRGLWENRIHLGVPVQENTFSTSGLSI